MALPHPVVTRVLPVGQDQPIQVVTIPQNVDTKHTTPFQVMLDSVVGALQEASNVEHKTNRLIEGFVQDKVSTEEVTIATAELNLKVSMITSIVSTAAQTLKEVTNMQV